MKGFLDTNQNKKAWMTCLFPGECLCYICDLISWLHNVKIIRLTGKQEKQNILCGKMSAVWALVPKNNEYVLSMEMRWVVEN